MDEKRLDQLIMTYRDGLFRHRAVLDEALAVDREHGGFLTYLDRDGSVYCTDKPVWLQGRIVWLFSKLYNEVEKRPEWLELAKHGLDFLLKHCFDTDGTDVLPRHPRRQRRCASAGICSRRHSRSWRWRSMPGRPARTGPGRGRPRSTTCLIRYHTTPGLLEPKEVPGTRPSKSHAMPMILLATTPDHAPGGRPPDLSRRSIDRSLHEVFNHFCKPEMRALLENVGPNGEFIDTPDGPVRAIPATPSRPRGSSWRRADSETTAS